MRVPGRTGKRSWRRSDRARVASAPIALLLAVVALGLLAVAAVAAGGEPAPVLVSRGDGAHGAPSEVAYAGSPDADGGRIAFLSGSLDGHPGGIYLRDRRHRRTRFLAAGSSPQLAAGGTRLVYNAEGQVYALDLRNGGRQLVSRRAAGVTGGDRGSSGPGTISADGRYVAFASSATDLLGPRESRREGKLLRRGQVYVRDLVRRRTVLVSRGAGADGPIGDQESGEATIAADGRYVAFTSEAANLLPGAPRRRQTVYVRDLRSGAVRAASRFGKGPHRSSAAHPSISADGRYVAFELGRFGHPQTIVVRDLRRGTTLVPSRFPATPIQVAVDAEPAISPDGRYLAFRGGLEHGGLQKLFLVDLRSHRVGLAGSVGAQGETRLAFSGDGRFLVYDTYVQNVPGRESGESVTETGGVYRLATSSLP